MSAAWRLASVVCLIVAALAVWGAGSGAVAGVESRYMETGQHHMVAAPHDCCEPEPQPADDFCGSACAPTCTLAISPQMLATAWPIGRRTDLWRATAALLDGIAPEMSPPPPR